MVDFDPAKDAINVAKHGISLARWVDLEIRPNRSITANLAIGLTV
jgi:uncharacterized DUF497 family protein